MKLLVRVLGIVIVLILAVVVALPFLVDANQFRPTLETKLTQALGREVKVGDLKLTILSGSVTASDLSIADNPAFSRTPFLRASALKAGVDLIPLILSRKLNVTGISIEKPEIDLVQNAAGVWNFSSLGAAPGQAPAPPLAPAASSPSGAPDFSIAEIKIADGHLTMSRLGGKAKPLILDKVNIEVKNFSPASPFPFSLSASLLAGGTIKLDGTAGPIHAGDAISTPFDAKLSVSHLDLADSGILDPSAGLAGLASIDGSAKSEHATVAVQGKLKGEQLKLVKAGTPAKRAVELDFTVVHDLKKLQGNVERATIHIGSAAATLTGTYRLESEPPTVNLKLAGSKMAVTELAAILPALDVVLPTGASIEQGTAEVNLASQGPLDKLVTTGTFGIENARLANYDLGSKLKVLETLAGIKAEPHTTIQTLSAGVKNSVEGTALDNIQLVVPSIGSITGAGTVSPSHALDFKMRLATTGATLAALGSKNGIPFSISGTAENPSFKPDVRGIATEKLKDLAGSKSVSDAAGGLIQGLFGGKKKQP